MVVDVNGAGALQVSHGLPLCRVRAGHVLSCRLLSGSFVSLASHWVGGQSALCAADGGFCPGCESKPARLLGYTVVSVFREGRDWPMLLEVSGASVPAVRDIVADVGAGGGFEAFRRSSKSPVVVNLLESSPVYVGGFDSLWRLLAAIATLYKLPLPPRGDDCARVWGEQCLSARRATLSRLLASER